MTPVRGMLLDRRRWRDRRHTSLLQIYKATLGPSMRAAVPIEHDGVRGLVAVGIIVEAIDHPVGDHLPMLIIAAVKEVADRVVVEEDRVERIYWAAWCASESCG